MDRCRSLCQLLLACLPCPCIFLAAAFPPSLSSLLVVASPYFLCIVSRGLGLAVLLRGSPPCDVAFCHCNGPRPRRRAPLPSRASAVRMESRAQNRAPSAASCVWFVGSVGASGSCGASSLSFASSACCLHGLAGSRASCPVGLCAARSSPHVPTAPPRPRGVHPGALSPPASLSVLQLLALKLSFFRSAASFFILVSIADSSPSPLLASAHGTLRAFSASPPPEGMSVGAASGWLDAWAVRRVTYRWKSLFWSRSVQTSLARKSEVHEAEEVVALVATTCLAPQA